jgi:hypothetical protein
LQVDGALLDPEQDQVTAIHLDGRTDVLEGFLELFQIDLGPISGSGSGFSHR